MLGRYGLRPGESQPALTRALIYHDVTEAADADAGRLPRAAGRALQARAGGLRASPRRDRRDRAGASACSHDGADVALTFDDGGASALEIARRLEERDWRGYFFVTTGRIGTPGFVGRDRGPRARPAAGTSSAATPPTHPAYMGRLTAEELRREWVTSRDALAELLGRAPGTAAVPGGFLSRAGAGGGRPRGLLGLLMTSQPSLARSPPPSAT